ncbi:uncharacterized protein SPPG_05894 [Spizellomyces punctatus DAOM BR117]|uniref:TmcB/TmcC TPR repeats domain-containing protein n=1 Tax=Spizellomyces punctatus (strain DAOM BR117) TaxID=645134 RepID=A0A0L0HD43_SPIPD|nr:uncharacterized protein SPPG_05894 [Spizellomyces punctatus DAOM BR117]KNC98931.1 hypothetical protein SPPG_05894 [Spizellomyces punctatus DAOM BR117]|eukprot:XP_016606971.1 hypothetical protein SPPG_05894 [Spizellomyces punctatus DAOM BR117]
MKIFDRPSAIARQKQVEEGLNPEDQPLPATSILSKKSLSALEAKNCVMGSTVMPEDAEKGAVTGKVLENAGKIIRKRYVQPLVVFSQFQDVEIACRFLQYNRDPEALHLAKAIFAAGVRQFPKSPRLRLMQAYYIALYDISHIDEVFDCLIAAKKLKPAFDTRFFIFFEERTMEQEDRKEELMISTLNVTEYAEITAMEHGAQRYHLNSLLSLKLLWQYLKNEKIVISCIPYLLEAVEKNRKIADLHYQSIISKYPKSKQVLRRYSNFLINVCGDHEKARKLLERAEDIENQEVRESSMRSANERLRKENQFGNEEFDIENSSAYVQAEELSLPRQDCADIVQVTDLDLNALGAPDLPRRSGVDTSSGRRRSVRIEEEGSLGGERREKKMNLERMPSPVTPVPMMAIKQPSVVDSTASSQREIRQQKYYRELIEFKLFAPVQQYRYLINIALLCLLGILIAGCTVSVLGYSAITEALQDAYARLRPRGTFMRICRVIREIVAITQGILPVRSTQTALETRVATLSQYVNGVWIPTILPILQRNHLDDEPRIIIKMSRGSGSRLEVFSPYFLGQLIAEYAQSLVNSSLSTFTAPEISARTDIRIFLDNILSIAQSYDSLTDGAMTSYLSYQRNNTMAMVAILVALPLLCFLIGVVLFRPIIERAYEKQLQILSLFGSFPKKYANQKLDDLEIEIEAIMEELEADTDGAVAESAPKSFNITLPREVVMARHSPKRMIKLLTMCLSLVGLTGTLMFIPPIQQGQYARNAVNTIRYLSDRTFYVGLSSTIAVEVAAQDNTCWMPGMQTLWLEYYLDRYDAANRALLITTSDAPSLYDFPETQVVLKTGGFCLLQDPNGCDDDKREYNATIGFTKGLVTSSSEFIIHKWYESMRQFLSSPPLQQTFANEQLQLAISLGDDISGAAAMMNNLIVDHVEKTSSTQKAINVFIFALSLAIFGLSYILVFRRIMEKIKGELGSIVWLLFTLPTDIVQSIPELKRFIESGGALLPQRKQL